MVSGIMDENTKIFGIGLSKTGTVSLMKALTILGSRTIHFPEDKTTQDELRWGKYNLSVLNDVQALVDIPVAPYYAQFDRLFPASKFILTTRPTASWLVSMENHFRFWVEHRRDAYNDFVLACVYGALHFSADRFSYVKELHEANVRRYFADRPDKLLVLDIFEGDGWEELCGFLACPVPNAPYPHENRRLSSPAKAAKGNNLLKRLLRRIN
jgi:Sulfotransferase domain